MIDSLYARYSRYKDKQKQPKPYKALDAIEGQYLLKPGRHRLAVIFPGWHTHSFPVSVLASRLEKKGWTVLRYDFDDQIILSQEKVVKRSFSYASEAIVKDLKSLTTKHPYRDIHFIGISLGNVMMALVAEKFKYFSSATFVVAGDDLAIDMWHGLRTLYLRDEFKKEDISLEKLDKAWHDEAPKNHAERFSGKKVKFILSKTDKFILPKYQLSLIKKLDRAGSQISLKKRRSGHLITILRYCLIDRLP